MSRIGEPTVAILELLAERQRASRSELATATGLSAATVGRAVARLRRQGLLREVAVDAIGAGRPPHIVELDDHSASVVAIDAGGRTLRATVASVGGRLGARIARPVRDPADPDALLDDLVALVHALAETVGPGTIHAVVAGISGIVDHANGRVLLSPDLPGLNGIAVAARLATRLELPAAVDNDDLLAAIGEATAGAAMGCRDVVFLSLGYGLGAGLIVGGSPVRGASHAAGAIAYLGPGRFDERASGRAIPLRYRELVGGRGPAVADARQVFELAEAGDPAAIQVVADVVGSLGDLAVDVAALLDPEVIVVGGGLADAGSALFGPLESRLRASLPYPPRLVASALEDAAVLHGAVSLALTLARRRLAGLASVADTTPDRSAVPML
ncbi:MAG: ROK family transcriptional regulator [Chloroflexota bacterium]